MVMDNQQLQHVIETAEAEAEKRDLPNFAALLAELRQYLHGGSDLPPVLAHSDRGSVQQAQNVLARAEAHLDRVLAIQFNVKVTLQALEYVETLVLKELVSAGIIPPKSSGPAEKRIVASHVPTLTQVRGKLELMENLCVMAQKRLGSLRDTVKLMSALDDNLRWAQYRQPG